MEFVIPQHLDLDSTEQNLFLWVIRPFWRDTKTLFRCSMSGWQTPIYFEVKRGDFSNIPGNAILSATYIHLSEDPLAQYLNYSRNLRAMTGSRVIPQKSKFLSLSLCVTLSSTPLLHSLVVRDDKLRFPKSNFAGADLFTVSPLTTADMLKWSRFKITRLRLRWMDLAGTRINAETPRN